MSNETGALCGAPRPFSMPSMHPSAEKGSSRKSISGILHKRLPRLTFPPGCPGPMQGSQHKMLWRWIDMQKGA